MLCLACHAGVHSWYELNIDRNNSEDYSKNMTEEQCAEVVNHWYEKFYKPYGKAPVAFVWDDGWDHYGTWTFNKNFPNGFSAADKTGRLMGAGQGAWLGPVGGYGQSVRTAGITGRIRAACS